MQRSDRFVWSVQFSVLLRLFLHFANCRFVSVVMPMVHENRIVCVKLRDICSSLSRPYYYLLTSWFVFYTFHCWQRYNQFIIWMRSKEGGSEGGYSRKDCDKNSVAFRMKYERTDARARNETVWIFLGKAKKLAKLSQSRSLFSLSKTSLIGLSIHSWCLFLDPMFLGVRCARTAQNNAYNQFIYSPPHHMYLYIQIDFVATKKNPFHGTVAKNDTLTTRPPDRESEQNLLNYYRLEAKNSFSAFSIAWFCLVLMRKHMFLRSLNI